jgi:hypothetical protein
VPEREGEAWFDCTAAMCDGSAELGARDRSVGLSGLFPLVGHERHSLRSRHALACARPAAPVKAGHSAAPHCGVALTGAGRGALKSEAAWCFGGMCRRSEGRYSDDVLPGRGEGDHFVSMFYRCNAKWTIPMHRARLDRQM